MGIPNRRLPPLVVLLGIISLFLAAVDLRKSAADAGSQTIWLMFDIRTHAGALDGSARLQPSAEMPNDPSGNGVSESLVMRDSIVSRGAPS